MSGKDDYKVLFEGHRCRLIRTGDDGLLFSEDPRYGLSFFFALMAVPLVWIVIADWTLWSEADGSQFRKLLNGGNLLGWAFYVMIMTISIGFVIILSYFSLQFFFGRRCEFMERTLQVRCVPGLGLESNLQDVESVAICTSQHKGRVACNVVLILQRNSRTRLVLVNGWPVVKRAWTWLEEEDAETELREIKAHRPLAELIAERVGCDVEVRRSIGNLGLLRLVLLP